MLFLILFLSVGFVAFTNGSNANVKGVASLYGSGTTSLRWTIGWGTLTTLAGSIAAIFLAEGLLDKFSGKGLVRDELLQSPIFTAAVALGAAFTSFLATRLGFPVSTTHALVGALTGAGMAGASQDSVALSALGKNFLFPLLFSPLLAIALGGMTYWALRWLALAPDHRNRYLDAAHFASAGAASFARGLNDTPKMAALLLLVPSISHRFAILFIGIAIAIGAVLDAKKVAETLGKKVTSMTPGQGFAANVVTAILVTTASFHSMPVSTTHVSVGSLFGMGASTRQLHWRKVFEIGLAWLTTVPCGAVFAALAYFLLQLAFAE